MNVFEGMTKVLLKDITGNEFQDFPRMTFADAMQKYGNDKPDIRFGMEFVERERNARDLQKLATRTT